MLKQIRSFARAAWRRPAFERDMDNEMRFHLDARTAHFLRQGLAPEEAARRARREVGNVTLYRDRCRDSRRLTIWDDLRNDLRFALRNMRKDAFLSTAIVATLAVGIGATAAMFSAVNAALLRPLPFPDPSQLVMVFAGPAGPLSVFGPDYMEWRPHSQRGPWCGGGRSGAASSALPPGWSAGRSVSRGTPRRWSASCRTASASPIAPRHGSRRPCSRLATTRISGSSRASVRVSRCRKQTRSSRR